jgi:hypothetical protein
VALRRSRSIKSPASNQRGRIHFSKCPSSLGRHRRTSGQTARRENILGSRCHPTRSGSDSGRRRRILLFWAELAVSAVVCLLRCDVKAASASYLKAAQGRRALEECYLSPLKRDHRLERRHISLFVSCCSSSFRRQGFLVGSVFTIRQTLDDLYVA